MSADWRTEQQTIEKLVAGGASQPNAFRHTFVLRLIPTFHDDPEAEPRWYGELEHYSRDECKPKTAFTDDIDELINHLAERIKSTLLSNQPAIKRENDRN